MLWNPFSRIRRTYRHVRRYRDITTVLMKHGLDDLVATLGLRQHRPFRLLFKPPARSPVAGEEMTRYVRVRLALEELGPTFIKFGQMLSTRRDLVPPDLILELEKLQDRVPPFPTAEARVIVERDLGRSMSEIFSYFAPEPDASASIAQVYDACLADGRRVAVKVRRPRIEALVAVDLGILKNLASLTERILADAHIFQPVRVVDEFARTIRKELDFSLEISHMERFARNFAGDTRMRVPEVYREFCGGGVITMEYVKGLKVSRVDEFPAHGLNPEVVADRGAELILEQVFKHGFFHADPHPGNIIILPDNVICLFDYGNMGTLSERLREQLTRLIVGFVDRDEHRIAIAVGQISGNSGAARLEDLESDIRNFVEDYLYRPLGDINVGQVLSGLSRLLIRHEIHMPPTFFLMVKCLTLIESIGRQLMPDFDLLRYLQPYSRKLIHEQVSFKKVFHDASIMASEVRTLLRDMPGEVRQLLSLFKHGELGFQFEHRGLDDLRRTHDQVSNRIVFGIVLAALIIGSSIIVLSGVPPTWHEIPIIGVAGYSVSGLMGFWLLYSIIKHNRM